MNRLIKRLCRTSSLAVIACLLMVAAHAKVPEVVPLDLRCEYLVNPVGIDVCEPRLSWKLMVTLPDVRNVRQSAYQILVASSPEVLARDQGDVWDSGQVSTDDSVNIPFAGKQLASREQLYWKVRAWYGGRKPSAWSKPSDWEMGFLRNEDWSAKWIEASPPAELKGEYSPVPILRKEFLLSGKVVAKARLYVTALGLYEMHLNGQRIGDHIFAPDWTDYKKRVRYQVYDITSLIQPGTNALAGLLGNGWYSGHIGNGGFQAWGKVPALFAQLEVTFADGSTQCITTDAGWKTHPSPVLSSDIMLGENYDARLEIPGWDQPGLDTSKWSAATERAEKPRPLDGQVDE